MAPITGKLIGGLDNRTGIKPLNSRNVLLSNNNYFFPYFWFAKILVLPLLMASTQCNICVLLLLITSGHLLAYMIVGTIVNSFIIII